MCRVPYIIIIVSSGCSGCFLQFYCFLPKSILIRQKMTGPWTEQGCFEGSSLKPHIPCGFGSQTHSPIVLPHRSGTYSADVVHGHLGDGDVNVWRFAPMAPNLLVVVLMIFKLRQTMALWQKANDGYTPQNMVRSVKVTKSSLSSWGYS